MGGGGAGQGRGATFHSIAGRGLSQPRGQRVSLLSPCSLSPQSPPRPICRPLTTGWTSEVAPIPSTGTEGQSGFYRAGRVLGTR